ncbi:TonB-dependent receptor [Usitatibacter palustris]|uniref:TonB-dependent receptor n=1 Tax=Usitatibacter palustris TaxID=2732487 RepID=UPI001BB18637|nr:TonB-dependent receptor [Usitatibacter palustris]
MAQSAAPDPKNKPDETKQEVTTVETVVVTAERRSRPLQTSPISATVLSGDDLANKGITVVDQLMFVTPSATVNNFGQGIDFNIRGIGKGEHNSQTTTGVVTYRDGVATFPGYFTGEPYYDIATVEILRGPQGTFVGQNATGGAVFVTSNDPIIGGGHSGYVQGQLGNYNDFGLQGTLNIPLADTLAARVAFNTEDRDSFWNIDGPYTGSDARLRLRSARVGLNWQPNSALTVLFKTDYSHLDFGAYPADPVNGANDLFDVTANAELRAVDWLVRSVLHVDYRFANGLLLRSISGYQKGNTQYRTDLDGTRTGNNTFRDSVDERIYSQEFNLLSPNAGWMKWILGAYWQKDTLGFPPKEFVIGVPPGSPASEYVLDGTNPKETWAAFGKIGFDLTDRLELELGGRYTRSTTANDVNVVQYGLPLKQIQEAEYTDFSGKAALNFKLDSKQFLYAFAASGFRPGGLNVPVGLGIPPPFDEEKVTSYELGWKSIWLEGKVRTQLTAFHNDYKNFQVIVGYPTFPTFGFELNVPGTTKISGFEAQVQASLDDWKFDAGLGAMRSSLGRFYAVDPRGASVVPCDPSTGPASASCIALEGRDQTYAPDLTFNFGVQREFRVGDDIITPRFNYGYISEQWATLFQNESRGDRIESRRIVNAQIAWLHGKYLWTLYGTNLTDQHYVAAINSGLRFAGAPRQYGLRLAMSF